MPTPSIHAHDLTELIVIELQSLLPLIMAALRSIMADAAAVQSAVYGSCVRNTSWLSMVPAIAPMGISVVISARVRNKTKIRFFIFSSSIYVFNFFLN